MAATVSRLPFGLSEIVAPTLLGFALINACTFSLDLACLTALHGGLGWPLPVAITIAYGTAFSVSYVLNRVLNFHSHGAVATQVPVYVAVVVTNYLVWILGVGDGLATAGVDYRLARVLAGMGEAVFMYCALRWVVFRDLAEVDE
jgi:putative flippase GtrA